ncbi:MAG TPA: PAS domain S-box protein, partial [Flavisolibacter sp.]|nr:PAS domain S-box protein [Flavisolibacter sp.]
DVVANAGMGLLKGGRWVATFGMHSNVPRKWTETDIWLLEETAERTWAAVERAKAEKALRRSEERLRLAGQIAKTVVWEWNVVENKIETTDNFVEVYGFSTIQFAQQGYDLLHADDRQEHLQKVQKAATEGGGYHSRFRVVRPDTKEIVWLEEHAYSIHDEQGKVVKLVGAAIDITELKKNEEEIRGRETRFRTLANAVPQVIWTNTGDGIANYFNQRWYEFTGLTYEQSEGPGWQVIVHPDDAPASVEKWKKALLVGEVFDTEYRLRRHDGSYCWFIGRNVPLKDDSGKVTGWFGSATDVESLKKTEEALSQSEASLKITMESATDYAIITMDTERKVERWSQGATQILGYTEAEMIGRSADFIFTDEDKEAGAPQQEMVTARDRGRAADERWHRRKDDSRFYASGVMRPIQGTVLTGYVKVLRDNTQQQLFTEELHRLVAERTRELQRSNDDLQRFASIASHDLQEPLRKLKLFTSVLQKFKKELPKEGIELLSKIHVTSDRMSQLIREVLLFSKTAYGAKEFVPTDLNEILQNVLGDLDMLLDETGTTLAYDGDLPRIEAAPSQINQLFYNLLTNAVKFRKEGSKPVIRITTHPVPEGEAKNYPDLQQDKDYIEIVVSDNGIGFEQQYAEQIFQIFERLHTVDEFEGTGVGLALCKKIAENHSGHIYAVSAEGKGAAFHILLPVKQ